MDALGLIHIIYRVAALGTGAGVLLARKGTRLHRSVGHLYVAAMLGLNFTALFIYDLTGGPNFFHLAAVLSLVTLILGLVPAIIRRPRRGWLNLHLGLMSGSYVGLVAAAAAVMAVGAFLIQRRMGTPVAGLAPRFTREG